MFKRRLFDPPGPASSASGLNQVAAQLQDLMSYEFAHRFPADWPKKHGTVYALASQQAKYLVHLRHKAKPPPPKPDRRGQGPVKGASAANLTHFQAPQPTQVWHI